MKTNTSQTSNFTRLVTVALAIVFFISCDSTQKKQEHDHHDSSISLNDGMKWKVNEEMKPYLENGAKLIQDFNSNESNDYKALAENLKEQNDSLIRSCTMKGKSHEELHKWLHPHLGLVKELSDAAHSDEAGEVVSRLEESYHTYQMYFE